MLAGLLESKKLDVKNKGRVGRDEAREATVTVGVVWRAGELGTLADAHLGDAFVPSL